MSALTLLREPQFRRIFLAQSVSTLGDQIAPIAVAFAVLATTHSATALGLVPASRTVPLVVFALLGGAWVDRLPRKGLMVTSDLVRLCTQGAFALILTQHSPALWAMVLLQAGNGAASAFFHGTGAGGNSRRRAAERKWVTAGDEQHLRPRRPRDRRRTHRPCRQSLGSRGALRISTEIIAAIEVDIARLVALFGITHFVILNGDFGTQGGRSRESSEGAHDVGGRRQKCADLQVVYDHPSETGERADRGELLTIVRAVIRLPFGPSPAVTTCSVGFSGRQKAARAARESAPTSSARLPCSAAATVIP